MYEADDLVVCMECRKMKFSSGFRSFVSYYSILPFYFK